MGVCARRGVGRLAGMVLALLALPAHTPASARVVLGDAAPEYQVKAAFLTTFAKFVQWPAARQPQGAAPVVIGVIGPDPFGPYLREAAAGKLVDGHPLEVRPVVDPRRLSGVHLLFVPASSRQLLPDLVRQAEQAGVLTVGDSEGFGAAGLVLNLYLDERRVRFEANQAAAHRAGLRLSAQLLQMARLVEDRR